jgi:hypothetical protein
MSWRDAALFIPLAAVLLPVLFRLTGWVANGYSRHRFRTMSPAKRERLIRREAERTALEMGAALAVLTVAIGKIADRPPDESDYLDKR